MTGAFDNNCSSKFSIIFAKGHPSAFAVRTHYVADNGSNHNNVDFMLYSEKSFKQPDDSIDHLIHSAEFQRDNDKEDVVRASGKCNESISEDKTYIDCDINVTFNDGSPLKIH